MGRVDNVIISLSAFSYIDPMRDSFLAEWLHVMAIMLSGEWENLSVRHIRLTKAFVSSTSKFSLLFHHYLFSNFPGSCIKWINNRTECPSSLKIMRLQSSVREGLHVLEHRSGKWGKRK